MSTWSKRIIKIDNGKEVEAQFPLIISASRSTDIPAFYSKWFLYRMREKGYSAWKNPFNGKYSYVSYDDTRFIVFWSKNPRPLIENGVLDYLDDKCIKYYIQYTLNDYEKEDLEKGVPSLQYRIDTFRMLSERLGKHRVIWRFDPLIFANGICIDSLLEKTEQLGNQLSPYTEKMVFSFADILNYTKVYNNLRKNNIEFCDWTEEQMNEFALRLSTLNKKCGWNFQLATCGEKIDIEKYGIEHNRCIDGDLITRIAWKDKELMRLMKIEIKQVQSSFFGESIPPNAIMLDANHYFISNHKKDAGQRSLCGCMAAKDIGQYNTCTHLCEYCYANTSKQSANANYQRHILNPYSETITGE